MARSHLTANRLEEAIETYAAILNDYPDDVEVLLVLGNLYLASGDSGSAESLYTRALSLDPENNEIKKQVLLAQSEEPSVQAEPVPMDPDALARLLMRLTGRKMPVTEQEMQKAADLLHEILEHPSPAQIVAERLDEINDLLPALIEINIRQARAHGQADLAQSLQNLQINIASQMEENSKERSEGKHLPANPPGTTVKSEHKLFTGKVLVIIPDPTDISKRMMMVINGLKQAGCKVKKSNVFSKKADSVADLVIISNPHLNEKNVENFTGVTAFGIPVIVDLDDNFEEMPVNHPEYNKKGLATPQRARAYASSLLLASMITVPSEEMEKSLSASGYPVKYLPDGWDRTNRLWIRSSNPRKNVNIGLIGEAEPLEDIFEMRRVLLRIMREFPETQLIVIGNPQAYRLFGPLPPNRRYYLPMVSKEEYPYLLAQMDVILVPHRKIPYNLKKADQLLVEAGVKHLPWIASDIPAYVKWAKGGLIAHSLNEWHANLRQLVMDKDLRKNLGDEGAIKAQGREQQLLGQQWQRLITNVLETMETDSGPEKTDHKKRLTSKLNGVL